jgi:hypothetical protein
MISKTPVSLRDDPVLQQEDTQVPEQNLSCLLESNWKHSYHRNSIKKNNLVLQNYKRIGVIIDNKCF